MSMSPGRVCVRMSGRGLESDSLAARAYRSEERSLRITVVKVRPVMRSLFVLTV